MVMLLRRDSRCRDEMHISIPRAMLARDSHLVPRRAGILSCKTRKVHESRRRRKGFPDQPRKWIDRVHQRQAFEKLILDPDSSVRKTYGRMERVA